MVTDLTVGLMNRPGTLAQASDTLGRAGINIEGACGFVCEGIEEAFHTVVGLSGLQLCHRIASSVCA